MPVAFQACVLFHCARHRCCRDGQTQGRRQQHLEREAELTQCGAHPLDRLNRRWVFVGHLLLVLLLWLIASSRVG